MYSDTRFGSLLKAFPRQTFNRLVREQKSDRHTKGFSSWDQMVAMIYAQVSNAKSLRQLEAGFNQQETAHYHLGSRPIRRSTLADANNTRCPDLFRDVCTALLQQTHRRYRKNTSELLYLMDSTPISLTGYGFEWAKQNKTNRTTGLKVHVQVADQSLPVHASISHPSKPDVVLGRDTHIETGATYVFDKGYYDYNWWHDIHQSGAYFVTRFKCNAGVTYVRSLPVVDETGTVVSDEVVAFKTRRPGGRRINRYYGTEVRKVVIKRPDCDKDLVLVTNDFKRSALEIGELYKSRWGIELFFKWLKQNLKIKRFLGRSENAVKVQIYTALIAYLLAHTLHRNEQSSSPLSIWLSELTGQLFMRRETEYAKHKRRQTELKQLRQLQPELAL